MKINFKNIFNNFGGLFKFSIKRKKAKKENARNELVQEMKEFIFMVLKAGLESGYEMIFYQDSIKIVNHNLPVNHPDYDPFILIDKEKNFIQFGTAPLLLMDHNEIVLFYDKVKNKYDKPLLKK